MDTAKIHTTPRRTDVKRRKITQHDDVAEARRADKLLSRDQINACIKAWDAVAREKGRVHGDKMKTVYSNERCLTWGTPLPMTLSEAVMHNKFAQGMGVEDVSDMESRPIYVVGRWLLEGEMILTSAVVHPTIATATVALSPNVDGSEALLRCFDGMDVVSEPSSGRMNHAVGTSGGKVRLMGRFSLRGSESAHISKGEVPEPPTYANMSSSCIVFVVSLRGKTWVCHPTMRTIRLLSFRTEGKIHSNVHSERLVIYGWDRSDTYDSHIKVSSNGSVTVVGSPEYSAEY